MKVYGALESAQIEWFTNAGKPAASSYPFRVIYVTDLKQIQVSDGTNWNPSALYTYTDATLPAASSSNQYHIAFITDTLQVKVSNGTEWKTIGARLDTYTSGTIPAAASNANSIIWVSDLQQVQVSNGTAWVQVGSKAGTKNYFSQNNANSDFETNSVSPWSACTLTFSSGIPSGAPTLSATQMSIATTSTTPLSGTYSMQLTKAAANAQYQGFISGALTIDREDTAKVLYGSFYYEVVSGTIDLSGSSTQSLEIWIYNTVSGQWTQPAGYRGMNQSSGVGRVVFSFQTDGTYANNAYKIAVITQQTGTSAFVVKFDDFQVGPQAIVLGAAMTDWQSYTPTLTNITIGNGSVEGKWRRVGDSAEYQIAVISGSTTTYSAGFFTFGLYTGHVMDLTKMPLNASAGTALGQAAILKFGTARLGGTVIANGTTSVVVFNPSGGTGGNIAVGADALDNNSPYTWAGAGDTFSIIFKVPIVGWGSFSQVSSDTDTRVVAASYRGSGTQSGNNIDLTFTTREIDTHAAFSSTTFTTPVSGQYNIGAVVRVDSQAVGNHIHVLDIYVNGSQRVQIGYTPNFATAPINTLTGTAMVQLNAGDTVTIRASNSGGTSVTYSTRNVSIHRLSGSSVITATETVAAKYYCSGSQSIPSNTTINFDQKSFDTHNIVSTGATWTATAPISGKYLVSCYIYTSGFPSTASWNVTLYKGVSISNVFNEFTVSAGSRGSLNGSTIISLTAGETIYIKTNVGAGTPTLDNSAGAGVYNYIQIVRVGN